MMLIRRKTTMWEPDLLHADGPIYEQIAAALERDIRAGVLSNGPRLPTLKALALLLKVTPGTVNRAYELAQRRGLVQGEVGRGTYVRAPERAADPAGAPAAAAAPLSAEPHSEWVDLSIVKPNLQLQEPYVRA